MKIRSFAFSALLGLLLAGCVNAPEYSDTPEIEFNSISRVRVVRNGAELDEDTVKVVLNYYDGDGDLGLGGAGAPASDALPPYAVETSPMQFTLLNNYFVRLQVRRGTAAFRDTIIGSATEYDGRYPRLPPGEYRPGPKKGELRRKFFFTEGTFPPNTELRFLIRITDRALRESNTVTTEPILIP